VEVKFVESDNPLDTKVKIANQNYDLIILGLAELSLIEPLNFKDTSKLPY